MGKHVQHKNPIMRAVVMRFFLLMSPSYIQVKYAASSKSRTRDTCVYLYRSFGKYVKLSKLDFHQQKSTCSVGWICSGSRPSQQQLNPRAEGSRINYIRSRGIP